MSSLSFENGTSDFRARIQKATTKEPSTDEPMGKPSREPHYIDDGRESKNRLRLISCAQELQEIMSSRSKFLPAEIISDVPWDILLALYVQDDDNPISLASLSSLVSSSTSAFTRWLLYLEGQMLVTTMETSPDPERRILTLAPRGWEIMDASLTAMLRI